MNIQKAKGRGQEECATCHGTGLCGRTYSGAAGVSAESLVVCSCVRHEIGGRCWCEHGSDSRGEEELNGMKTLDGAHVWYGVECSPDCDGGAGHAHIMVGCVDCNGKRPGSSART
jgi:hypothetical protein